ncbi:stressosome-associated protein Prli42 [Priestia taiwanensis]|nr:stressosome-associated protein Prli42 [Priestia taiwanensis]
MKQKKMQKIFIYLMLFIMVFTTLISGITMFM